MKIIFMGTPEFSVPCLEMLVNKGYEVVAVVTQTDKPVGRKQSSSVFTPVKKAAIRLGITNVLQPEKLRTPEFTSQIREMAPDLIITIAYGKILPKAILDIPVNGCINVHGSLLPKYRGAAPIQWAIINGDSISGVTTMYMDEGMDTGDMLLKREVEITEDMTYSQLYEKLEKLSPEVLSDTLDMLRKGTLVRIPQNNSEAVSVPMMKKEMGLIDWTKTSRQIHNLVRGTNPWPGAYTNYKNCRLKIWKTTILNAASVECDGSDSCLRITSEGRQVKPGEITKILKEYIIVATGDGFLKVNELQYESCRRMGVNECGHNMDVGEVFG